MGPEESMQIQSNIASTIAMAFDECIPYPATEEYVQNSVERKQAAQYKVQKTKSNKQKN